MNKWKVAFFISLTITILTILGAGFIVLSNTILSGHSYDNLITITQDMEKISRAVQNGAHSIDEFDRELEKIDTGHNTDREYHKISLQILSIVFDDKNQFKGIKTGYENDLIRANKKD
ncbi:MAG: hypothetical protein ACK5TU_09310 [Cyclobacteriaceae bacterium]|jgi:hypothetical protein